MKKQLFLIIIGLFAFAGSITAQNCSTIHLKPVGKTSLNCGDSSNLYAYMNKDWEECSGLSSPDTDYLQFSFRFINNQNIGYLCRWSFVNGTVYQSYIYKTTNGGFGWQKLFDARSFYYLTYKNVVPVDVFFVTENIGYAISNFDGNVIKTIDGGLNWTAETTGTTKRLQKCYFLDENNGLVVGENGTILKTTDGGTNWILQSSGTTSLLLSVYFINANNAIIVGDNGTILRTINGGTTWTPINNSYTYLKSVFFTSSNVGYIVACYGIILKTINAGITWTPLTSGTTNWLNSVYFTDANTGYAAGAGGILIKTINAGSTWAALNSNTAHDLSSLSFYDSNNGIAVGDSGTIIKTNDGGSTWLTTAGNSGNKLSSIYFTDVATGFAVGDKGVIIKTSDTVNTWFQTASGTTANLKKIHFLNATTGIAVGDSGKIVKTTTSGNTWSLQTSGTTTNLKSGYMITGFYCVAVGDNGKIIRSTDGGFTWGNITSNTTNTLNSVFFSGTNNGYAVGLSGTIIKSTDGGASWNIITSGVANDLYAVHFPSSTTGYAVGSGGKIIKTINGGTSWTSLSSGVTNNLKSVYFKDANTGYAVGDNGKIISTVNGGETWVPEISNTTYALGAVFMVNNFSFAAGANGIILRNKAIDMNSNYYLWQPVTRLSDASIFNPVAKPLTTTTYKVTVLQGNGCPPLTDSIKLMVTQLVVDATGGQTINCRDTIQLGVTQNFSSNCYTYSWAPTSGLNNPNIKTPKASPSGTTQYKVTISTNNGCGSPKDSTVISLTPMLSAPLCMVTVLNNKNKLLWDKPVETAIDSFYIYRETAVTNVYQKIGATSYNDSSVFIDNASNADIQSNKYQISIKDKCLLESPKSGAHKTMHLTINQGMGTVWNLIWEPYEGFTVSTYRILRGTTPTNLTLIGTTSGSSTQYTDNTAPAGYIYYQLEVISPDMCNPSKGINTSVSNIATNNPITGICYEYELKNISIYPNPVANLLQIQTTLNLESVEITDLTGRLMIKDSQKAIDCSYLANGVYFIRIETEMGIVVMKFLKK